MAQRSAIILIATAAAIAAAVLFFTPSKEVHPREKKSGAEPDAETTIERNYAVLPASSAAEGERRNHAAGPAVNAPNPDADKEISLAAIQEAAITYDPASLPAIAPYLKSRDPEVRAAAADGIVVLGDAAGSKFLRDAAKTARSPAEAADWQQKADYLELPPATPELLKEMRALREQRAARQKSAPESGAITQPSPVPLQR